MPYIYQGNPIGLTNDNGSDSSNIQSKLNTRVMCTYFFQPLGNIQKRKRKRKRADQQIKKTKEKFQSHAICPFFFVGSS